MSDVHINKKCERCGKKKKWLAAAPHHGIYCEACIRELRKNDALALAEIRNQKRIEKESKNE